jgi:HD-GYP domain-containing protein (c-di-GMP phosphodiesterase class II)
MIIPRQFGCRIRSFFNRLVRPFQSQDSVNERREIPAKSTKAALPNSPFNGELGDSSKLLKIAAELQKASAQSPQELLTALRTLATASDGVDPYTRGHSERVTRFAVEIAKIMELPDEEIERIRIGALTHDIGKIAIQEEVLNKPSLLTSSEYALMKTHTTQGYELLKDIPQLKEILPGVQFHHEQLDGNGYPHGLTGNEIPMIARIITVADCFDAMITARPYQDPTPMEHALGILRSSAGLKFDNRVVDALIQGVRTGRIKARSEDRVKSEN